MKIEQLKYILLLVGVLLPFLNGIFETEKSKDETNKRKLKKLTTLGRFLLIGGLLLGLGGIFQTYRDDKENAEKQKLSKVKYENERKIDSLNFAHKNFTDSISFSRINGELQATKILAEQNKNKIINNAIGLSKVALTSVNEAKYPIPKKFIINMEGELDLPKTTSNIKDKLIDIYKFNLNDKAVQGFGLDDANKNYFSDELLLILHSFDYSHLDYEIEFFKKDELLLSIRDFGSTNLVNYKTKHYKNSPAGLRNEIRLFYYPRINAFKIVFSQVEIDAKTYLKASSLLNLKDCTIKIRFLGTTFAEQGKNLILKLKGLDRLSIATPENLFLYFDNLKEKDDNGKIVTVNRKNNWR